MNKYTAILFLHFIWITYSNAQNRAPVNSEDLKQLYENEYRKKGLSKDIQSNSFTANHNSIIPETKINTKGETEYLVRVADNNQPIYDLDKPLTTTSNTNDECEPYTTSPSVDYISPAISSNSSILKTDTNKYNLTGKVNSNSLDVGIYDTSDDYNGKIHYYNPIYSNDSGEIRLNNFPNEYITTDNCIKGGHIDATTSVAIGNDQVGIKSAGTATEATGSWIYGYHNRSYRNEYIEGSYISYSSMSSSPYNDYQLDRNYYHTFFRAAGNSRTFGSTYGNHKNAVSVGNIYAIDINESNLNEPISPNRIRIARGSSKGPVLKDNRIKPDIVSMGTRVSVKNLVSGTSGTSFSAPNAAAAGLLLQELSLEKTEKPLHSSSIKALMIHTAREAGFGPGPDYIYGWGALNAKASADMILDNINLDTPNCIYEETLSNGNTYEISVTPKFDEPIIATLVWNDPYKNDKTLVNNLDLRIYDKDGNEYLPFVGDTHCSKAIKADNNVDNVEKVVVARPNSFGEYKIVVSHKGELNGLFGMEEDFSLIISGHSNVSDVNIESHFTTLRQDVVIENGQNIIYDKSKLVIDENTNVIQVKGNLEIKNYGITNLNQTDFNIHVKNGGFLNLNNVDLVNVDIIVDKGGTLVVNNKLVTNSNIYLTTGSTININENTNSLICTLTKLGIDNENFLGYTQEELLNNVNFDVEIVESNPIVSEVKIQNISHNNNDEIKSINISSGKNVDTEIMAGNVIIESDKTVTYLAKDYISLEVGFESKLNSDFTAEIIPNVNDTSLPKIKNIKPVINLFYDEREFIVNCGGFYSNDFPKSSSTLQALSEDFTTENDIQLYSGKLNISPNPSNDFINLNINDLTFENGDVFNVKINSVQTGQVVYTDVIKSTHHSINIQELPQGVYILTTIKNGDSSTIEKQKIIKL